jgi:hypothetical protein
LLDASERWRASSGGQILAATHQPDGSHAALSGEVVAAEVARAERG